MGHDTYALQGHKIIARLRRGALEQNNAAIYWLMGVPHLYGEYSGTGEIVAFPAWRLKLALWLACRFKTLTREQRFLRRCVGWCEQHPGNRLDIDFS